MGAFPLTGLKILSSSLLIRSCESIRIVVMAKERTQRLPLSPEKRKECERLAEVKGSGWWRIQKDEIPSFVPEGMRSKLDGGVMVMLGSSSGVTQLMYGAERVDKPAGELDIQPFGMTVFSSGASTGMALIHHGDWIDRTTPLPPDFWRVASSCSTASYFFANPPEGKTSGSLDELGPGHKYAFEKISLALSGSSSS